MNGRGITKVTARPAAPYASNKPMIVSQLGSYSAAEGVVPAASSGFDHHKKVNGRKRHILTDTLGLLKLWVRRG